LLRSSQRRHLSLRAKRGNPLLEYFCNYLFNNRFVFLVTIFNVDFTKQPAFL